MALLTSHWEEEENDKEEEGRRVTRGPVCPQPLGPDRLDFMMRTRKGGKEGGKRLSNDCFLRVIAQNREEDD